VSIGVGEALEGIGNLATGDIVKSQKAYRNTWPATAGSARYAL
jgi:hypothetical protein